MARPERFERPPPRFVVKGFKSWNRQEARGLRKIQILVAAWSAPVSHQKPTSPKHNKHDQSPTKTDQNQRSRSFHPLIAVWLQVRVLSEPTTKSIAQSAVYGRGGLSPQLPGKCLHRQSGLRALLLTPKKSTIENRGQLLSFSFAVAPNRTMSLWPPFHFGLA